MQLDKNNSSTTIGSWISAHETAILSRFAERATRADVATEDAGGFACSPFSRSTLRENGRILQ